MVPEGRLRRLAPFLDRRGASRSCTSLWRGQSWQLLLLLCVGCRFDSGGLGRQSSPFDETRSTGGTQGADSSNGSAAKSDPIGGSTGGAGTTFTENSSGGQSAAPATSGGGGDSERVDFETGGMHAVSVSEAGSGGANSDSSSSSATDANTTNSGGTAQSSSQDSAPIGATNSGGMGQTSNSQSGTQLGGPGSGGAGNTSGSSGGGNTTRCSPSAFGAPEPIPALLPAGFSYSSPFLSADGLSLYFSASKAGEGEEDIYVATRSSRTSGFYPAAALTEINSSAADGAPCASYDGKTFYFSSTRPGGLGGRDLYVAQRGSANGLLDGVRPLTGLNGTADDTFPWIASDGLTLLFSSTRSGATDLFVATRPDVGSNFSAPVALDRVNTSHREDRATLSHDGLTIYFVSDRPSGVGDRDIWYATRGDLESAFSNVRNLESVNSQFRDVDVALSADDQELYFVSKRGGQLEIYRSIRKCP